MSLVILDLFCGAGGAAMGYHHAFPDADIIGVDIHRQPRYPFIFVRGDATKFPLDGVDLVHASPPCQDYSTLHGFDRGTAWMLHHTKRRLAESGIPHVIENVPGAIVDLDPTVRLCGTSFGLQVQRHRHFRCTFHVPQPPCLHNGTPVGVYGGGNGGRAAMKDAMGIGWMKHHELVQAIPPAYTHHIGRAFARHLERKQR